MISISFRVGGEVSQQVAREVNALKETLRRDKIECLLGHLTPIQRFECACYVFDLNE
jgi:hypothetical protein